MRQYISFRAPVESTADGMEKCILEISVDMICSIEVLNYQHPGDGPVCKDDVLISISANLKPLNPEHQCYISVESGRTYMQARDPPRKVILERPTR